MTPVNGTPSVASGEFVSATRVHEALTAGVEKRLLLWLAARLPRGINSDHLTILGAAAQLGAGLCYAASRWHAEFLWLGIVCLALNWFGDSLDGTVARLRNQQRPRYGYYVDHVADAFGSVFLMTGLACSGYVHGAIAMAMLLGFLLLSIESYLAASVLGRFHMSQGIFGPTEIRILLAAGNVGLYFHPYSLLLGHRYLLFDVGGVIASAGMLTMVALSAARHTAELYRAERLA
jgi:phosphatidylglycerophosphate synthase